MSTFWRAGHSGTVSGTFAGTMEGEGMHPDVVGAGWTVTYYDDITPKTMAMDAVFDKTIMDMAHYAAKEIADEIKEIYEAGGEPEWKPVVPWWLAYKAEHGYDTRTMHQTNRLWGNVQQLDRHLYSTYEPNSGTFVLGGFDEAFRGTEYVWLHELVGVGAAHTRRPFIFQGVMRGLNAMAMGTDFIEQIYEQIQNKVTPMTIRVAEPGGVPSVASQYAWHKTKFHTSLISLLWWVLPPSKVLAMYGAAMDMMSVASGKLLEPRYMSLWMTAYFKGMTADKFGIAATEKQIRRKARGGLYGRRR